MNKYTRVPTNHIPNYIKPNRERGQALVNPVTGKPMVIRPDGKLVEVAESSERDSYGSVSAKGANMLQPFPSNPHCKTNYIISNELKEEIYELIQVQGQSTQQVSQKYGLKIPRIEAIVKLMTIEKKWESHNRISPSLDTFAKTMYGMFPIFEPELTFQRENLSEIPVPEKTLSSRFITIAESEPFGPVDAAEVLELEPAVKTLEKLATVGEHSQGHHANGSEKHKKKVVYGAVKEGDRSIFKFTDARVGQVGFRYGSGNRDSKKDRKIGFDSLGKMIYI